MGVQIIRQSVGVWVGLVGWRLGGQRLVKRRVLVQVGPYFGMLPHEAGAAIETGIGRERLGNRGMLGQESLVALKRVGLRTGRGQPTAAAPPAVAPAGAVRAAPGILPLSAWVVKSRIFVALLGVRTAGDARNGP